MEKRDFAKEYSKWCEKEGLDATDIKSMKKFKEHLAELEGKKAKKEMKVARTPEKVEKQKKIFKAMCEYMEVDVAYDEDEEKDFFSAFDAGIKAIVGAVMLMKMKEEFGRIVGEED